MAEIKNVQSLMSKLRQKLTSVLPGTAGPTVLVGYQTNYAVYVHENLEAHHRVGQAKYLEQPARTMMGELGEIIKGEVANGRALRDGLLKAGLRLQRESQLLVPVKTGNLKNSAFTELEEP